MRFKTSQELSQIFLYIPNKTFPFYSFLAKRTNPDVKILRQASYCVTQYFDHEINQEQPEGTVVSASLMLTI